MLCFVFSVYFSCVYLNIVLATEPKPSYVVVNQGPKQVIRTKMSNIETLDPNVEAVLKKHMNSIKKLTAEFPDREIEVQLDLQKPKKQMMVMQRNEANGQHEQSYSNAGNGPSYISVQSVPNYPSVQNVPGYSNIQNYGSVQNVPAGYSGNYHSLQSVPRSFSGVRSLNSYPRVQLPNYEPINYVYEAPTYERNTFIPNYDPQYGQQYRRMEFMPDSYMSVRKRKTANADEKAEASQMQTEKESPVEPKGRLEEPGDIDGKKPVYWEDLKKALQDLEMRLSSQKQGVSVQQAKVKQLIDLLKQVGGSLNMWKNVKHCLTTELIKEDRRADPVSYIYVPKDTKNELNKEPKNPNFVNVINFGNAPCNQRSNTTVNKTKEIKWIPNLLKGFKKMKNENNYNRKTGRNQNKLVNFVNMYTPATIKPRVKLFPNRSNNSVKLKLDDDESDLDELEDISEETPKNFLRSKIRRITNNSLESKSTENFIKLMNFIDTHTKDSKFGSKEELDDEYIGLSELEDSSEDYSDVPHNLNKKKPEVKKYVVNSPIPFTRFKHSQQNDKPDFSNKENIQHKKDIMSQDKQNFKNKFSLFQQLHAIAEDKPLETSTITKKQNQEHNRDAIGFIHIVPRNKPIQKFTDPQDISYEMRENKNFDKFSVAKQYLLNLLPRIASLRQDHYLTFLYGTTDLLNELSLI